MNYNIDLNSSLDKNSKQLTCLYEKSLKKHLHLLNENTDIYEIMSLSLDYAINILNIKRNFGNSIREKNKFTCDFCVLCSSYIEVNEFKRNLPCGHTFHKKCIDKVVFKYLYNKCPCCDILL